ncbi:hypothetical protein [Mucilaginibacter gotjawali]|uniref:Uncharacterized protein n=2 Tax=Mucilaginibacter gotjawali TaxID=1550579 RepID=A0A839SPB7_9SPHI|nr:hypothetical protein [Mucilaginibacter gotjawali]MBB3059168.1 hypothetical protein [Mucilaginibacter gotjawali]BAU52245.1 hypothetical protein MgSA37_00395 [Mucilaginibacter gotjawali]
MKFLFLSLLFLTSSPLSTRTNNRFLPAIAPPDSILAKLKASKAAIDKYVAQHPKNLIVLVKVPGKKNLVRVINEKWPDEIEYTYNIMIGQPGKVIFIDQIPYSESGDWFIEYKHYFDERGNTFAFSKEESIFDDSVKGGIVRTTLLKYFDAGFKNISQVDKLTDKDGNEIKKNKNNFNFREYKYAIYKSVKDCLDGYYINYSQLKLPL